MSCQPKIPAEQHKNQSRDQSRDQGGGALNRPPLTIGAPANGDYSEQNSQKAADSPTGWHKFFTWPEGILAIATILTFAAIAWQSIETRRSASAMKGSVRLQEEAIRGRIAITGLELDQPVSVGGRLRLVVRWKNIGYSALSWSSGQGVERWRGMPRGDIPIGVGKVREGFVLAQEAVGTLELIDLAPITKDFLEGLPQGSNLRDPGKFETTYFFGRIVYTTLGKEYAVEFCSFVIDLIDFEDRRLPRYCIAAAPKWNKSE